MSSITLNTLKVAANKESSDNGFYMNAEAGWNSYSADEYQMDSRVNAPGSFASEQAFASRATPSFEGVYAGSSGADAAMMKAYFKSIIQQGMNIPVTYDDAGFVTYRECKVAKVTIPHNSGRPGFKWAVDLISNDPYMYGPEGVTTTGLPVAGTGEVFPETYPVVFGTPAATGQATVVNSGYAPTYNKLEVSGGFDASGFTIVRTATGERITLTRAVPVTSTVYINTRSGRVSIDGPDNDISGFLTASDWWEIPPQSTETLQFLANGVTSGTPRLLVRTRPAYY